MTDRINTDAQQSADIPAGFKLGPGGLVVPATSEPALEREVWREEERRAIMQALKVARKHGIRLIVGCDDNRCAEDPVIHEEFDTVEQATVWRCGHKKRLLTRPWPKNPGRR